MMALPCRRLWVVKPQAASFCRTAGYPAGAHLLRLIYFFRLTGMILEEIKYSLEKSSLPHHLLDQLDQRVLGIVIDMGQARRADARQDPHGFTGGELAAHQV